MCAKALAPQALQELACLSQSLGAAELAARADQHLQGQVGHLQVLVHIGHHLSCSQQ